MIKWLSKKINVVNLPLIFLLALALGVISSTLLSWPGLKILLFLPLPIAIISLSFSLLRKNPLPLLLVVVFFGGTMLPIVYKTIYIRPVVPGCGIYTLQSVKPIGRSFLELGLKSEQGNLAVKTKSDKQFELSDDLKVCFSQEQVKVAGEYKSYYLSRYQTEQLVETDEIKFVSSHKSVRKSFAILTDKINSVFLVLMPGNAGQLAKGLLFGDPEFSDTFSSQIKKSGLTHIVAVSGYNVSIILVVMFGLLRKYTGKRAAFWLSIGGLIGFCLLSGGSSSVVRAAIMGLCAIIGKMAGRKSQGLNLLTLAGVLMLLYNPFLIYDIGFQLSFVATTGIFFSEKVIGLIQIPRFETLIKILAETICAQIFCFGIILYHFGTVTLIGLFSNIFILPLVPLAMLLVAILLVIGLANIELALLCNIFLGLPVLYIKKVIEIFSLPTVGVFSLTGFGLGGLLVYYLLVVMVVFYITMKYDQKQQKQV